MPEIPEKSKFKLKIFLQERRQVWHQTEKLSRFSRCVGEVITFGSLSDNISAIRLSRCCRRSRQLIQLRGARTAAHLTQEKLSEYLMIPRIVLNYLERQKNLTYINTTPKKVDELLIKNIFEGYGIMFPNDFSISLRQKIQSDL